MPARAAHRRRSSCSPLIVLGRRRACSRAARREDGTHVVREEPLAFNLRYPDPMREIAPAAGEWLHLEREGLRHVRRRAAAAARRTRATSAACCPCRPRASWRRSASASRTSSRSRRARRASTRSRATRWSSAPAASRGSTAGSCCCPQPGQGTRDGVKLLLLANPDAGADKARDVGTRGPLKTPYRSFRFGTEGPVTIDFDQFLAVDMRVGRVIAVEDFPEARKPAWKLTIDFGAEIGTKRSSAQVTNYSREELEGRRVVAVVNFPPRQIGPVRSEVLVLGASDEQGRVILLAPDADVPLGARIH